MPYVPKDSVAILVPTRLSVNQYATDPQAREELTRGAMEARCSGCGARGRFIRHGTYGRGCYLPTGETVEGRIQRVRCKECGATPAVLPDVLHPARRYSLAGIYQAVRAYLIEGQGYGRIRKAQEASGVVMSTLREWVDAFARGARLWRPRLQRALYALKPTAPPPPAPPAHLGRVANPQRRAAVGEAYAFFVLAEVFYAAVAEQEPELVFRLERLFPFLLLWAQGLGIRPPPRLMWNPRLESTPSQPF